jgi:hypothetical protein
VSATSRPFGLSILRFQVSDFDLFHFRDFSIFRFSDFAIANDRARRPELVGFPRNGDQPT